MPEPYFGCDCDKEWVECEACGGTGEGFEHDCGEDTCCCLDPVDNVDCVTCDGRGGWYRCPPVFDEPAQ